MAEVPVEGRFGAVHALCVARKGVLLDQPRRDVVGDDDSDAGRVENVIASGDPLGLAGNDSESVVAADDVISDVHLIRENDTEAATVIPFDQILLHGHRARIRNEQSGAEVVEESATQDPNISGFLCAHSGLPIAGEGAVAHLDVVGGVDEATEPSEWFDGSATHQAVEHEVVVAGGDDRWADAIFAPENRRLPSIPRAEHERAFGRTGMDIRPQPERREHTLTTKPRRTAEADVPTAGTPCGGRVRSGVRRFRCPRAAYSRLHRESGHPRLASGGNFPPAEERIASMLSWDTLTNKEVDGKNGVHRYPILLRWRLSTSRNQKTGV